MLEHVTNSIEQPRPIHWPEPMRKLPTAGGCQFMGRNGRRQPWPPVAEQDSYVLTGSDQVVLDLLPPEPAPTGSLEAMTIGRIGKTAFHKMLPPPPIFSRRCAVGPEAQPVQLCLTFETLKAPPDLAGRALRAQGTLGADRSLRLILPSRLVAPLLITAQRFSGRTSVGIAGRVINKLIRPEIGLRCTAWVVGGFPIGHVGVEPPIGASQKVFGCAILAVRHNGLHGNGSVLLMLPNQT